MVYALTGYLLQSGLLGDVHRRHQVGEVVRLHQADRIADEEIALPVDHVELLHVLHEEIELFESGSPVGGEPVHLVARHLDESVGLEEIRLHLGLLFPQAAAHFTDDESDIHQHTASGAAADGGHHEDVDRHVVRGAGDAVGHIEQLFLGYFQDSVLDDRHDGIDVLEQRQTAQGPNLTGARLHGELHPVGREPFLDFRVLLQVSQQLPGFDRDVDFLPGFQLDRPRHHFLIGIGVYAN